MIEKQERPASESFDQQSTISNHQLHPALMPTASKPVVGAAPEGARDPDAAARAVREMFTSIAPRYDLLNHVLSFNVDRLWWRRTARSFAQILAQPDSRVFYLCCGTGDMTFAL